MQGDQLLQACSTKLWPLQGRLHITTHKGSIKLHSPPGALQVGRPKLTQGNNAESRNPQDHNQYKHRSISKRGQSQVGARCTPTPTCTHQLDRSVLTPFLAPDL